MGIEAYLEGDIDIQSSIDFEQVNDFKMSFTNFKISNTRGDLQSVFKSGENIVFSVEIAVFEKIRNPIFSLRLTDQNNVNVVTWRSNDYIESPFPDQIENKITIKLTTRDLFLIEGRYRLSMSCLDGKEMLDFYGDFIAFDVTPDRPNDKFYSIDRKKASNSVVYSEASWTVKSY
jgi:lipopolysaccharide transport system ATP-binding protein